MIPTETLLGDTIFTCACAIEVREGILQIKHTFTPKCCPAEIESIIIEQLNREVNILIRDISYIENKYGETIIIMNNGDRLRVTENAQVSEHDDGYISSVEADDQPTIEYHKNYKETLYEAIRQAMFKRNRKMTATWKLQPLDVNPEDV